MKNGEADDPELTAGLQGFLEGVERKVTGEDHSLVAWTAEAVAHRDDVSPPPEELQRPVWEDGRWRDATKMDGGLIIGAPPDADADVHDSTSTNADGPTLGGQALDGIERLDEGSQSD